MVARAHMAAACAPLAARRRLAQLGQQLAPSAAPAAATAAVEGDSAEFALPMVACLINNEWVSTDEPTLQINAWDGTRITDVVVAGEAEVDAAVAAARAAFKGWKTMAPLEHTAILNRFADLLEQNAEQLAQIECLELGKPIEEARGGVAIFLLTYRYYAGCTDKFMGVRRKIQRLSSTATLYYRLSKSLVQ